VLKSAGACPAPLPPAYSEAPDSELYKQAAEVHRVSTQITQEQRQFALYWSDDPLKTPTPAGHWAFIANDLLKLRKANLANAAETFARLNMAMADAFVASWHTKYTVNLLRPVSYIQLTIDSNWVPTLMHTPPFPEYPSGHSVQSSAAAAVLGSSFGETASFVDNTHNDRGWGPRTFKSFKSAADEAALSRLYAGIHYRAAVVGGQTQGACVAQKVLALKFKP
jgi:membrane-associated phospholipid phosphatase